MREIPIHLHPASDPIPDTSALITNPGVRVTVLTDRLLRIECSKLDEFEDRASQVFLSRRLPVPQFQVKRDDKSLEIDTGRLWLRIESAIGDHSSELTTFRLAGQDLRNGSDAG